MQRQYRAIKRELPPGSILMFRLGDFYEMFGEDAVIASPILGATLTQRAGAPLCGIPYHALDAYLAKLIRAGKTAAICDQMEDPRLVKKGQVVRREVTRIVTPGTVTEDGLLDAGTNTYIAAVSDLGLALLDLSTGEFAVEPFETRDRLDDALARLRPAEIVLPRPEDDAPPPAGVSYTDAWTFSFDAAQEELLRHFNVTALDGFGLEGKKDLVCAAGALLYYVHTTLRHAVGHVRSVRLRESADFLALRVARGVAPRRAQRHAHADGRAPPRRVDPPAAAAGGGYQRAPRLRGGVREGPHPALVPAGAPRRRARPRAPHREGGFRPRQRA